LCTSLSPIAACAGIEREQVNYINAHATSTLVGDIAEVKAVRSVFSDWSNIKMNGTKSMVGHCLGAAAGVEAIATIQAIRRGEVHPTINHEVRGRDAEQPRRITTRNRLLSHHARRQAMRSTAVACPVPHRGIAVRPGP
jgi:3-oxoacyl-(acyl-carrier-protein) synthase